MGTRTNGPNDLVRFGRGEDEFNMGRWFFNDFQQCVEASGGNHMCFVDDEDLKAITGGREGGALTQIACIFDTTVTSGIDLDNVE